MRIGISSYTFTWAVGVPGVALPAAPMDAFGLVDRAAASGLSLVQIADNCPLDRLPRERLAEFARHARAAGVAVQPGTRGLATAHLLRFLEIARQLGADLVRTLTDTETHRPDEAEIVALLRAVLPAYRRAGVRLALENHDRLDTAAFLRILAAVGDDGNGFGICLDTVNSFGSLEGPEVVAERLLPHTINLHVKDFAIFREPHKMGFRIEGRPAGRGRLDIPGLFARLAAQRRNADAILELWTPPAATPEETLRREAAWAEESVRYLQDLQRKAI